MSQNAMKALPPAAELHQDWRQGTGYDVSQSDKVEKAALQEAFDLVRQARFMGAQARLWATRTSDHTHRTLARLRGHANDDSTQRKIAQATEWQRETLKVFNSYMLKSAEILEHLKRFNPPLKNIQVRSLQESVTIERRTTITAFENLTETLQELMSMRNAWSLNTNNLAFHPAP